MSIKLNNISYSYENDTPLEYQALHQISLEIDDGSYTAIVGHTGSGKSTLLQHFNGLLKPSEGYLSVNGLKIDKDTKNRDLNTLRKDVGFIFQFPESQLFEETVIKDIAFAPKNFGMSDHQANEVAKKAAKMVGLSESLFEKSPFELSGGQMRRVAIAGIIAMQPKILILDEPTAGLDPIGRKQIMDLFYKLHQEYKMTIILVTHQMNDVADYADHVIVLEDGKKIADTTPRELFKNKQWIVKHHLSLPQAMEFAFELQAKGINFEKMPLTLSELVDELEKRGIQHE